MNTRITYYVEIINGSSESKLFCGTDYEKAKAIKAELDEKLRDCKVEVKSKIEIE